MADIQIATRQRNVSSDLSRTARPLPGRFLDWQIAARRAMYEAILAGQHPRRHPAHLPVMITFEAQGEFPIRVATKGAGLTPRDEVLDRYIRLLEETLGRCAGRPWDETLPERVAAARALYDHPEDIDPRRLGFLEIFAGGTYRNLQRDPRVVLHFTGEGPDYLSFQINGRAEILDKNDPRYQYIALTRRLFEGAPFHLPQPDYAAAYLVWVEEVIDKTPFSLGQPATEETVTFREILVPVDNSKYSTWAMEIALQIARAYNATIVGNHVYAARLHDKRFRDMEPGLPEQYQRPEVLAHQRALHDDLIERGLRLISESYLETLRRRCQAAGIPFQGKTPEGKNYAQLVRDIEESRYDLVVMGVRGIGEVWRRGKRHNFVLGSVCERVVRRVSRDVLVVKNERRLGDTFVVAVDGSERAFAALRIAISLAKKFNARVHVVAAYDPFLHKALFKELEDALTEEARRVFNTEAQKKLHDELVDKGIARLYREHLETAKRIAQELDFEVETRLLAGKAYAAVLRYVEKVKPSLLLVGRTGIHADEDLDIGSNAENLLRLAPCHVLLVGRTFTPTWAETRQVLEEGLAWTPEALARLERVPDFARGMARRAIEDYARQRGLTLVDEEVVLEARRHLGM